MPPVSQVQRRAMYAAKEGNSNLGIPQKVGAEMVKAGHGVRGLPERAELRGSRHDRPLRFSFAHHGTTVEGPHRAGAKRAAATFTTGDQEDAQDFAHAGTTREGPNRSAAAGAGASKGGPTRGTEAKAFANSGSTKEGYYTTNCATDAASADHYPGSVTRPKIRRKSGSREHSGGSPDGFRVHTKPSPRENAGSASHYGTNQDEMQSREQDPYAAKRPGMRSATLDMGIKPSPSPTPPGRPGRHAFKMAAGPK